MNHINVTLSRNEDNWLWRFYQNCLLWLPKRIRRNIFSRIYSFHQDKYDEVVSLGANCVAATTLRLVGLRQSAYPFDWISKDDLYDRFSLISRRFERFFDIDDFSFTIKHGKYYAYNHRTNYLMPHDFGKASEGAPDLKYNVAKEKYRRRINRLCNELVGKKVLMVYFEATDEDIVGKKEAIEHLIHLMDVAKIDLKCHRMDLLIFHGVDIADVKERNISKITSLNTDIYIATYNKNNFLKKSGMIFMLN